MKGRIRTNVDARIHDVDRVMTEAIIRAMTFAISMDGRVDSAEVEALNSALTLFTWEREDIDAVSYARESLDEFMSRGEAREEDVSDFCAYLAMLAEEAWLQDEIYVLVATIIGADLDITDAEMRLLSTLGAAFDIFAQRKLRLDQRVFGRVR